MGNGIRYLPVPGENEGGPSDAVSVENPQTVTVQASANDGLQTIMVFSISLQLAGYSIAVESARPTGSCPAMIIQMNQRIQPLDHIHIAGALFRSRLTPHHRIQDLSSDLGRNKGMRSSPDHVEQGILLLRSQIGAIPAGR